MDNDFKVSWSSIQGKSHKKIDPQIPCQDAFKYDKIKIGGLKRLLSIKKPIIFDVSVVSDGAGSSTYSHLASSFCVNRLLELCKSRSIAIEELTAYDFKKEEEKKLILEGWSKLSLELFNQTRADLLLFGEESGHEPKDLYCTLILVIKTPFGFLSANIGDGRAGYSNGTETTFCESKFVAQGLTQKTQELEFSSSFDSASKVTYVNDALKIKNQYTSKQWIEDNTPRRSGCCVIATALESNGIWTTERKNVLVEWCEKYLHDKMLGECFRRGYQVLSSKLGAPLLKSKNPIAKVVSKYYVWSWNNGTNMVMGKKFNPLSIPNSIFFITIFMAVGAVVTKNFADKTWKKLYN